TRARKRHARQTEQRDLEAVTHRNRDHRDAIDEREAVEAETGREPELPAPHGEVLAHQRHLLHRVVAGRRRHVERLQEDELTEAQNGSASWRERVESKTG